MRTKVHDDRRERKQKNTNTQLPTLLPRNNQTLSFNTKTDNHSLLVGALNGTHNIFYFVYENNNRNTTKQSNNQTSKSASAEFMLLDFLEHHEGNDTTGGKVAWKIGSKGKIALGNGKGLGLERREAQHEMGEKRDEELACFLFRLHRQIPSSLDNTTLGLFMTDGFLFYFSNILL